MCRIIQFPDTGHDHKNDGDGFVEAVSLVLILMLFLKAIEWGFKAYAH